MIARSQEASAGIIKAFAKAVDQVPPNIELRKNDAQGELIPTDGTGVGGENIYIKINDPAGSDPGGNPAYPTPSGIYKVALTNISGNVFEPFKISPAGSMIPLERTLYGLEDGPYTLTAYDGLGNKTSVSFTIRRSPVISSFAVSPSAVSGPGGSVIAFTVAAASVDVTCDIFVAGSSPTAVTRGLIRQLAGSESYTGIEQYDYSTDFSTWSALPWTLYRTTAPAGGGGAYKAGFAAGWAGDVLGGALPVSTAPYTLVLRVTDANGSAAESTAEFYVLPDTVPPVISWREPWWDGSVHERNVQGANTLETASWLHVGDSTSSLAAFSFYDAGRGVGTFSIYSATVSAPAPYFSARFVNGQEFLLGGLLLPEDATGYRLLAADSLGNTTTAYFHLDRHAPEIRLSSVTVNRIPFGYSLDVAGTASDALSGLDTPVSLSEVPYGLSAYGMDVSSLPVLGRASASWPPLGPNSAGFAYAGLTASHPAPLDPDPEAAYGYYALSALDRSGLWGRGFVTLARQSRPELVTAAPVDVPWGGLLPKVYRGARLTIAAPPPAGCSWTTPPSGMGAALHASPRSPDPVELANLNSALAVLSGNGIEVTRNYVQQGYNVTAEGGEGVYTSTADVVLPDFVRLSTTSTRNTNTAAYSCTDPVTHAVSSGEYPPGTYLPVVTAAADMLGYQARLPYEFAPLVDYVNPGVGVKIAAGPLELTLSEVQAGGQVVITPTGQWPQVPDHHVAKNYAWDISVEAVFTTLELKVCLDTASLSDMQLSSASVWHLNRVTNAWENVTVELAGGCVKGRSAGASPFAVMVPVDDKAAPRTNAGYRGGTWRAADGRLYVSTRAYVNLYADDFVARGDISGVARIYNFINTPVDFNCVQGPFDPQAAYGSCANPVYAGPFNPEEGVREINYFSVDRSSNAESAQTVTLYADGTPPAASFVLNGAALAAGTTVNAITGDTFTITAADPLSNGVASGLAGTYLYVDASPEECATGAGTGGIAGPGSMGSCGNNHYAGPFTLAAGTHTVWYAAEDRVGNRSMRQAAVNVTEDLPPVSSATLSGVMGLNGWYTSPVGISFSAVDDSTGIAGTYYSLDGAPYAPVPPPGTVAPPAGWAYGERVRFTELSGAALTDYQALVKLDSGALIAAGKMRADCGDLRFYRDGTPLSYWLEGGCNTAQTRVWVKLPSLPAGGTMDAAMAYGNPSAVPASSGRGTFDFFDDFDENYVDYQRWRTVNGECPMYVRNGKLEFAACSTWSTLSKPWMIPLNSRPEKYVMETDVYGLNYGGDNAQAQIIALRWDGNFIGPNNPENGFALATFTGGSPMGAVTLVELAVEYGIHTVLEVNNVFQPEHWQKLAIADDSLGLDIMVDGAKVARYETTNRWGSLWALSGRDYPSPSSVYYDNFRIRKYAAAEPVG